MAKRRKSNGVQSIEQVFTELPLADGLAHIDVGGGHNTHVRLAYLLSAYTDIFACFQHTEQPRLRCHGQFADLIEENRSFVGDTEIAFTFADGTGKGALLMSEELAVNSPFRDGATVDGKILLAATGRTVVDNTWYNLLAHTAFADNQYRQIRRCHLQGDIQSMVQSIAVAYDVISLFGSLQFCCIHLTDKITYYI